MGRFLFPSEEKRCAAHLHGTPFRIRISSILDLYLSWMDSLRFWESDVKHPILVSCINLVSLDLVGNPRPLRRGGFTTALMLSSRDHPHGPAGCLIKNISGDSSDKEGPVHATPANDHCTVVYSIRFI